MRPASSEMRVLIVDDHEFNRRLLSEQLRAWGVDHACAESGEMALAMMQSAHNAGRAFQRRPARLRHAAAWMAWSWRLHIKRHPDLRETSLIMLTSGSQRSAAGAFIAAGCSVFLTKPLVRPAQLLDALTSSPARQGDVDCADRRSRFRSIGCDCRYPPSRIEEPARCACWSPKTTR